MFKLAWKGVLAHKVRLALTAIAIVLGVAFVAGSFVFTDTLKAAFDDLLTDVNADVDAYVRGESSFGTEGIPIPAAVLDDIRAVDGVANAVGAIEGWAQPIDKAGDAIGGQGPPNLGFAWSEEADGLNPLRIKDGNGRPPRASTEVVIDVATAGNNDFVLGDRIKVQLIGGTDEFEIVGLASFGDTDNLLGATLTLFDEGTAARVFDSVGFYDTISIAADPDVSEEEITARVGAVLPEGFEAVTAQVELDDQSVEFTEGLNFFNIMLLVFAGVAVVVGFFIIYNTFSIIVAQRTKEMALLRAVGATGRQVLGMMVTEAFVVGVLGSLVGIAAGVGLAVGVKAALAAVDIGFPEGPLTLAPRTIIVGMLVGVLVTLFSAIIPARKAARVPPVAAMRDPLPTKHRPLRRRLIIGALITGVGVLVLATGLLQLAKPEIVYVGLGAAMIFFGVTVLAPLVVRIFARVVGAPLPRLLGVSGALAQQNSIRRPRRTASTASALMIGVALVSLFAIFGSSAKASIEAIIIENFPAEYQVQPSGAEFSDPSLVGVSPNLAIELARQPEIAVASPIRFGFWRNPESPGDKGLYGVDPATLGDVFFVDVQTGSLAALTGDTVLISADVAENDELMVGDSIVMDFPITGQRQMEVVAVFAGEGLTDHLIPLETFADGFPLQLDSGVFVNGSVGVTAAESRAAIDRVIVDYPNADVNDQAEFIEQQQSAIDLLLNVLTALLALSIIIVLMGIANTLALSIYERTHEIGLLRAVGMARRQVRRMIRWEAVLMALFGGVLGLIVGAFLGWAVVAALASEGLRFTLPVGQMVGYLIAAAIGGVLASLVPASRGAKVDILEAISYE